MKEFVQNLGKTVPEGKTIYKKARPTVVRAHKQEPEQHDYQKVASDHDKAMDTMLLTPAERLKQKKLQQAQQREAELKAHTGMAA